MEVVKKSSLGLIKSIFNSNTDNIQHYSIINKMFNGSIEGLEFSKPIIQTNAGYILWKSNTIGPYIPISELKNENQKKIANQMVQSALSSIELKAKEFNESSDFIDKIIELPNEDSIFFTNNDNKITIILTEWGFTNDEFIKGQGVLKKVFDQTSKSFIISFKDNENNNLQGIECVLRLNESESEFTANENGLIKLNDMSINDVLTIKSPNHEFLERTIQINDKTQEIIIIDSSLNLTFYIKDHNNSPVSNENYFYKPESETPQNFTTNLEGVFNVTIPKSNTNFQILDKTNQVIFESQLPNNNQEYFINLTIQEESAPVTNFDEKIDKKIVIEILNWRKKPIKNQVLSFYGLESGKQLFTTNENGQFNLSSLEKNKEYSIFMEFKKTDWKQDFTHDNSNNKYTFIVKNKKLFWWWLPFVLIFFFLLSLIPTNVKHDFLVYDNQTKLPIEGSELNNIVGYQFQSIGVNNYTNQNGKLSVNLGSYSIFNQVFTGLKHNVSAFKIGYESIIDQTIQVSFFKTRTSKLYLDPIVIDTVYKMIDPKPIQKSNCNSGGDANETGGSSIREFDMSQKTGAFLFEYYTGQKFPDKINIYNSALKEVSSSKLIWSYNDVTEDTKFETINFTNRTITVEVIGGGNAESIWGYLVNCP